MVSLGEHCSQNERRADEATRDAVDWLKCEYMLDKVGEEFAGTISSVTSFGLFVELDEIYVEGLIHVTGLANDYFHFDPVKHRMLGERTNQSYRLGDRLRVKVARVDLDERKIDFDLAESEQPAKSNRVESERDTTRRRRGRTRGSSPTRRSCRRRRCRGCTGPSRPPRCGRRRRRCRPGCRPDRRSAAARGRSSTCG